VTKPASFKAASELLPAEMHVQQILIKLNYEASWKNNKTNNIINNDDIAIVIIIGVLIGMIIQQHNNNNQTVNAFANIDLHVML
jgi:uncharacterized membrane protein YraQ (UPF0718 family)